ncbi:hypothetical protein TSA1_32215 [Bradyrhizobium nitroreducens]|uniref:Uncharacterized protein n=1 Tax=Bradyrhizobium nitroreducens TaxID=709803 RepID=A0A2M6UJV0_9BRAD|nr:hypothetical protein TSA1_32215 [Bradyrhizobium nitroreducens]
MSGSDKLLELLSAYQARVSFSGELASLYLLNGLPRFSQLSQKRWHAEVILAFCLSALPSSIKGLSQTLINLFEAAS